MSHRCLKPFHGSPFAYRIHPKLLSMTWEAIPRLALICLPSSISYLSPHTRCLGNEGSCWRRVEGGRTGTSSVQSTSDQPYFLTHCSCCLKCPFLLSSRTQMTPLLWGIALWCVTHSWPLLSTSNIAITNSTHCTVMNDFSVCQPLPYSLHI